MNEKELRKQEYRDLMHHSRTVKEIGGGEFLDKLAKKESFLLYFGFDACPWCQEAAPLLIQAAEEESGSIDYIDTHANGTERMDYYEEIKEILIDHFRDYKGEKSLVTPLVLGIRNGEVHFAHHDTLPGHNAYHRRMTSREKETLQGIYREAFHSLR